MKKLMIGLMTTAMVVTANAQGLPAQSMLGKNMYKGKIGLSHIANPNDATIREMGKHTSAIAMPTKAETAKMLKKAIANRPALSKGNPGIIDMLSASKYTPADTLFFESWEGWDGQSIGWIPTSWTRFTKLTDYISQETGVCPTWMGIETDGYYLPYATHGDNILMCMYGEEVIGSDGHTVILPVPDQNEWMVSPTISNIQETNYLSFDLAFAPLYTHLFPNPDDEDNPDIDLNRIAYEMEVLITTNTRSASDNEANYTSVFKLSDIADEIIDKTDLEDSKAVASLMVMSWSHFKIALKEYAGKNIRVALRYKGKMGGAILVDAVRVSDMLPTAMFNRPDGSFYMGFSSDARLSYSKNVLMPAYTPARWRNFSNDDAESFLWTYEVNGESGTSTDVTLVMPSVNPGSIKWPTLQANSGFRADEYNGGCDVNVNNSIQHSDNGTAKVGGNSLITYTDGSQLNFSVGNFDPTKLYWLGEISQTGGAYAFGTGSGSFWGQMTDYQFNAVNGIANVYEAPAAPYIFNTVTMPLGDLFNIGANIVCTVYKAKDLGNDALEVTDEVLGQAMATEGTPVGGGYIMTFNFPNLMFIDSPIAILVSGFDDQNLISIAPLSQALNHDNGMGYGFVVLKHQSTGNTWWADISGALKAVEGGGNMNISHCLGMNATFPYLHSNDGDVFVANIAGESKAFDIDSFWYPEKKDESSLDGWTIKCSDSWITASYTIDEEEQKAYLNITAEALPQGVDGRTATVIIEATGCEETITVTQGNTSGIAGVTVNGFTAAKGTYSISGQRVNSNMAKHGLFIENRGGKFVKVVNK